MRDPIRNIVCDYEQLQTCHPSMYHVYIFKMACTNTNIHLKVTKGFQFKFTCVAVKLKKLSKRYVLHSATQKEERFNETLILFDINYKYRIPDSHFILWLVNKDRSR